ncbi:MAG: nitroreductase family deazaflavin-dependent oxidoreductase [Anaerolineae bacterium]|nr:nitroreductase family deazaflavin-dependent oxidoreductase [Anaerolineae bacterium]
MAAETKSANNPPRPPDWLFKHVINPTMRFILRSPLHSILSNGLALISFVGRKSGKRYTTPVAYHVVDEHTIMIFTRSKWWRNFDQGETITLRLKGQVHQGTAKIIQDQALVWEQISQYLERYEGDTRRVGIMLGEDATPEQIRAAAADMLAIVISLKGAHR